MVVGGGGGWVYQAKTNTALVQLLDGGLPELVNIIRLKGFRRESTLVHTLKPGIYYSYSFIFNMHFCYGDLKITQVNTSAMFACLSL